MTKRHAFFMGVLVGVALTLASLAWRNRPRNFAEDWPPEMVDHFRRTDSLFMQHARGYTIGPLSLIVPAEPHDVLVYAFVSGKPSSPFVMIADSNSNRVPDSFTLGDQQGRYATLEDTNEDHFFDRVSMATESSTNTITLMDKNYDGRVDYQMGPGNVIRKIGTITFTDASTFDLDDDGRITSKESWRRVSNHGLESTGAPPAAGTPETHP